MNEHLEHGVSADQDRRFGMLVALAVVVARGIHGALVHIE